MLKCTTAFFCVSLDKTFNAGDEITLEQFESLPAGYKSNFDESDGEITVVITEEILEDNPELAADGIEVGDTATFSGLVDEDRPE